MKFSTLLLNTSGLREGNRISSGAIAIGSKGKHLGSGQLQFHPLGVRCNIILVENAIALAMIPEFLEST
ncbi:hypothetical protein PROH_14925 [Prochlorothrix hollandica PCC 9006 = CALU 1027]|uniref:Uncharacterized protein n=1 Tax=Prochlorothrix hollandica PCC 9006 = CALU 1027 TaxID=317619 RepID=A0A0M2PRB8_PROHO|nr:hypothetical protein [Prochlorothrix hollandica]KKI99080.1 hypothetical protein PROH_14925 [Prochlorothrix hollandica PCC 9006 = CALU 1027]